MNNLESLLADFENAYASADPKNFAHCVSENFEWHQHNGTLPFGKIISGVDAVCNEIRWRQTHWKNVKYENQVNHFHRELIISTFQISGTDENGKSFCVKAVDLYPVENNRIVRKDTYWKHR